MSVARGTIEGMRSPVSSPRMIGREVDLEALRAEYVRSASEPRAVAIGGEAGIGKTRLVTEFARELGDDTLVLTGRVVDIGTENAPYAPFTAILRELAQAIGTDELLDAAGPARAVLSVLLPELSLDGALPQRAGTERLYELVTVLFEQVARDRRLVLVIEDIHWADRSTLELLRFLVGMLTGAGILILVTYRSDEIVRGHPLRPVLPELERSRRLTRWELARLTRDQVAAQVEAIASATSGRATVGQSDVDELFERSEGVPFFVEELAESGSGGTEAGPLPETLRGILLARYDRLDDDSQSLLRLLAVGGACVPHELLARVHTGTTAQLDVAVRAAIDGGVLIADSVGYDFRHALVRTAILGEVLPGERVRYHTAYADALEAQAATGQRVAYDVAQHRMEAHDASRAFPAAIAAMREAREAYDFARAAHMGERALELWEQVSDPAAAAGMDHVEFMQRTATAWRDAGDNDRALTVVDAALEECPPDRVEHRAELLTEKARYLAALSRTGSTGLLEEALGGLGPDACSETAAAVLGDLAGRLMLEARFDEAIGVASRALAQAEAAGSLSRRSVSHNIRGVSLVVSGRIDEGLADLHEAGLLAAQRDGAMLRYRVNMSDVMHLLGRYAEAVRIGDAGIERARSLGVERTSGIMLAANTVEPLAALGRWDEATTLLEPALALTPPPGFRVHLQRMKLWLLTWQGELAAADELWHAWAPMWRVQSQIEEQSRLGGARVEAELALGLGDIDRAWRAVGVLLHDHRPMSGYDLPLLASAAKTLTLLRRGSRRSDDELDRAESAFRAVLDGARDWPTARVWGPVVEAELADDGMDAPGWHVAVAAADLALAPAHLAAYTRFRHARALIAAGRRAEGQAELVAAHERADAVGSGLLISWIDDLSRRAGLEPAAAGTGAVVAGATAAGSTEDPASRLTDRERQVLELLAQGLSNKQIGERLYISTKTASVHVSAILRKLGATSRTEAAYLARREPAADALRSADAQSADARRADVQAAEAQPTRI